MRSTRAVLPGLALRDKSPWSRTLLVLMEQTKSLTVFQLTVDKGRLETAGPAACPYLRVARDEAAAPPGRAGAAARERVEQSGGHALSPHRPPRGPPGGQRTAPRAAAGRGVTLGAPFAPRPTRRTRPGMSRSPSGGCSCGGGGAEGRGHRPATRSPGSSCGGRRGSGGARPGGCWLDRGAQGSQQRMERVDRQGDALDAHRLKPGLVPSVGFRAFRSRT
ncbi:uncharacterized protein LOC116073712 [Mastomys coucha]|uniref:uncharacterized protein LOC116073712 n=1 Tax=Mastomys coucha TaxID=35658 RepID=UPI00126151B0|nr:uncharacterized protein LOC116073712 [Mastomys coucha]